MNGKPAWVGIAPAPKVFDQLDPEEITVLAFLAWTTATNRPATSSDVAALPDRNGNALGIVEARNVAKSLADMRVLSIRGMHNDEPLGVFLGGFQPFSRAARRPPAGGGVDARHPTGGPPSSGAARPGFPRPAGPGRSAPPRPTAPRFSDTPPGGRRPAAPGGQGEQSDGPPKLPYVVKEFRVEFGVSTTKRTPSYVMPEAERLRKEQGEIESGKYGDDLVGAARARLRVLNGRIDLYRRWLKDEPSHPALRPVLAKKKKALPELRYQLERAPLKKAQLEAEKAALEAEKAALEAEKAAEEK